MRPLQTDLSIYNKFNFKRPPVGIKYLFRKPEGIKPLDKKLALCEMLKEAHERSSPFYFTKENEDCFGKAALGMMGGEPPPIAESGLYGERLEVFQEPRANTRTVQHHYTLRKGIVRYVVFSPYDKLTFDPDLLVITGTPSQAEIVLRAMSYSTGEMWESKSTGVFSCSWLYVYPYLTGKLNYIITGMGHGTKGREAFPEGLMLISIPYNWIPTITQNLKEMKWVLPGWGTGRENFIKWEEQIIEKLYREFEEN